MKAGQVEPRSKFEFHFGMSGVSTMHTYVAVKYRHLNEMRSIARQTHV